MDIPQNTQAPLLRYVLGTRFRSSRAPQPGVAPAPVPAPGAATAKTDPVAKLLGVDAAAWTAKLEIPVYDLSRSNRLSEVRIYLAVAGTTPAPVTVDDWMDASRNFPFATGDVSQVQVGAVANLPLPDVAPGDYLGQVIFGYES